MESLKLSFFDLLTFLLPGGFFLTVVYGILQYYNLINFPIEDTSGILVIIPFLFLSYFIGHFISAVGRFLEKNYFEEYSWAVYLHQDEEIARKLNQLNKDLFKKDFYNADAIIDEKKSGAFFNDVYNYLSIHQHKEIIPILMAQYAFFKTATALWGLLLLIFFTICLYEEITTSSTHGVILSSAIFSLFGIFISINRTKERKMNMYAKVYIVFLSVNSNPK